MQHQSGRSVRSMLIARCAAMKPVTGDFFWLTLFGPVDFVRRGMSCFPHLGEASKKKEKRKLNMGLFTCEI